MNICRYRAMLFASTSIYALSIFIFLAGFLSVSVLDGFRWLARPAVGDNVREETVDRIQLESLENERSARLDNVVIFLIDALRLDFITGNTLGLTSLQHRLREGAAKGFLAKARTPTVTLPRLKALTTGTIPDFAEIITNFGTHTSVKDNFVDQLRKAGVRTVFYGDDTWLRMFPSAFVRSEGVSSFYVNDYTEVDLNVTRNVHAELLRDDWDIMILHYLGLDHIGHLLGPHSTVVPQKLRYYDNIIDEIFAHLQSLTGKSLLVVLGDHGMTDAGSHGGASSPEIDTPMIFLSPQFSPVPSHTESGHHQRSSEEVNFPVINQVDLASTISVLMGTPIPQSNLGVLVLPVVAEMLNSTKGTRRAVCSLANQLRTRLLHGSIREKLTRSQTYHCEANGEKQKGEEITDTEELLKVCGEAAETLSSASSDYGMLSMVSALILLAFLCFVFVLSFLWLWPSLLAECPKFILLLTVFHVLSLCGSSFVEEEHQMWYYWIPLSYAVLLARTRKSDLDYGSQVARIGLLFVLHRVLRAWNRTGDKWAHLPDIGDWIRQPEQSVVLKTSVLACCIIQASLRGPDVSMIVGLMCGTLYHVLSIDYFAWLAYLIALSKVSQFRLDVGSREWTCLRDAFIVLTLIISRPHNIPAFTLIHLLEYQLQTVLRRSKLPPLSIAFLYYLHASSTFFLFGNSNAISTVDVSAGFAGIPFYFAPLHGLLILVHTYAGPIFWMLTLAAIICLKLGNRAFLLVVTMFLVLDAVFLLITLTNATLQRHHLFIWTVFAPKVLYKSVGSWLTTFATMTALKITRT